MITIVKYLETVGTVSVASCASQSDWVKEGPLFVSYLSYIKNCISVYKYCIKGLSCQFMTSKGAVQKYF